MKKKGFTLSEVLITVAIIGVVAAMVVPIIKKKIWQIEQKSQFKKAYATLTNAIQKMTADVGYMPRCYFWITSPYGPASTCQAWDARGGCIKWTYPDGTPREPDYQGPRTECALLMSETKSQLKIMKECKTKAYENGCIPAYKGADTIITSENDTKTEDDAYIATAGDTSTREANMRNYPAYVLADGMIIFGSSSLLNTDYRIDINGSKPPNRWGYDLFRFLLRGDKSGKWKLTGYCSPVEKGGVCATKMIEDMNK